MGKFYQTKAFKSLEKEWDLKLTVSGFKDAEKTIAGERVLAQNSANAYWQSDQTRREAKLEYYQQLLHRALHEKFESALDKYIMLALATGMKRKQINTEIKGCGINMDRGTLRYIIRRFEYRWGIKNYTKHQMKLRKLPIRL